MSKAKDFQLVKDRYVAMGIDESHVDYAISAIQEGVKRAYIFENLTSDYRKVAIADADALIEDVYQVFGGEFKLENRQGYIWGSLMLFIGLALYFALPHFKKDPTFGYDGFGKYVYITMYGGIILGVLKIIAAFFNVHREDDE